MNAQTARDIIMSPKKALSWDKFRRKLLELKLRSFQPKILFRFEFKNFTIKTVENTSELWDVLKLRYDIFTKTYGVKMRFSEIDFDKLDLLGDHVVLIDNRNNRIIGTYRMICSDFSNEFYSESEFEIGKFKSLPGTKLELGRACIHEDYRNGASISLVWRGIARYLVECNADYLFGCTSVTTTNSRVAKAVLNYAQEGNSSNRFQIEPTAKYTYPNFDRPELVGGELDVEAYIPSLMKSYLSAGAKIYGKPALDRKFQCTDFFTVLDLEKITSTYYKRYVAPWKESAK